LEDNDECCDTRQDFITDLEKFITSLKVDKNHEVVLGIDANEMLYEEIGESVLLGLIEICGLIAVMASVNPDDYTQKNYQIWNATQLLDIIQRSLCPIH
jgi:hypothetical protein